MDSWRVFAALCPQYAFEPEVVIRINVPVLLFSVRGEWRRGSVWIWRSCSCKVRRTAVGTDQLARVAAGCVAGREQTTWIASQVALNLVLLAGAERH